MYTLTTLNELSLQAVCTDGQGTLYTKAGAYIGSNGQMKFEKVLFGPNGNRNPVGAIIGQIGRRLTGENMPLMAVNSAPGSTSIYASDQRHVTVITLRRGESIYVESEDLLAFTDDVSYSLKILAAGVLSQKGFFTSKLTGQSDNAQVAILTSGNPIMIQSGNGCMVDPDSLVAWTGNQEPQLKLNLSFKMLIGQASGESYAFTFNQPGSAVIIQPQERKSGLDIGIDGHHDGHSATVQQNQTLGGAANNVQGALQQIGNLFGGGGNRNGF